MPLRVFVLLTGLYFAQGLPFGFFTQAIPVLLRDAGLSLTAISLTSLLYLPWGLKFLWAPAVDRIGTRRQWLLATQLGSAGVVFALAATDLAGSLRWLFVAIAAINLLSATQDVATDGLAVRLLGPRERGVGNGIQTGAYRLGMIAGGGGLLWIYAESGWRVLLLTLGGLILLCTVPVVLLARDEPSGEVQRSSRGQDRRGRLGTAWWRRLRRPGVITLIGLLVAYKFGNSMASSIAGPFLHDAGLTLQQIALVSGALSSAGALAGSALGGWLAYRYGRRPALLFGGVSQTLAVGLFVAAALGIGGSAMVISATVLEHVFGGAALVALFTLMMDACERDDAGADYTLLASAVVAAQGLAGFAGAIVGDTLGYPAAFATGMVLSGIGCAVLVRGLDRGRGPAAITTWTRGRVPTP
ncbi:MFS transporter [Tsukamurella asaccharolytica]|uniref:MFS transporter n=1 Tax=Tsukamurella asaccharolytica TaxID=2592067 RepID=A0A5C5R8D3_9ACTN|nr:MFS transporter [Tsukamurella asaccharolytica]TWS19359.1 MFS transporter [Tsukamurella asaccharolytica]